MITEVVPLGTASAIPAYGRHLSATALRREGRVLLFDCGEGTQYRLPEAGLKRSRVDAIFITHLHGDHFYGTMGMLSTMALLHRTDPLTLVGPRGVAAILEQMPGLGSESLPFRVDFVELGEGFGRATVYETDAVTVTARPLDHRVFTVGYRFEEKPRPGRLFPEKARALGATEHHQFRRLKAGEPVTVDAGNVVRPEDVLGPERPGVSFAYVTDTRPCEEGVALAREADLVYHEATFAHPLQENAVETGHSTAREAALVARDAGAGRLLIGHFSARYRNPDVLADEARAVFQNTEAAQELKRYVLSNTNDESR